MSCKLSYSFVSKSTLLYCMGFLLGPKCRNLDLKNDFSIKLSPILVLSIIRWYEFNIVKYYKYQRNFQQKLLTGRNLWYIRLKLLCYYIHKIVLLICTFLYFYFLILSFISFIFPSFVYSNFVMFKASFHGFFSSFKFERFVYHMFLGFYFLLHWDASTAHFYLSLWQAQCGITQLIMVVMLSGIYWLLREGSLGYQRSLI